MGPDPVEQGDLDELVREVGRLCDRGDWDGLVDLRDRCRRALERGRQLWPAASLAEYRLALDAPGAWAGAVLVDGAGFGALGPLTEVAASTHTWADLEAHIPDGPLVAVTAHERAIHGDATAGATRRLDPGVLDLPLVLQPWEPAYPVATYHADRAELPAPEAPPLDRCALPAPGPTVDDLDVTLALAELTRTWTRDSNGTCATVAVEGSALNAIAALGLAAVRLGEVDAAGALARMAWAGASGGAHGRRRGMAAGRFDAWWALAALAGMLDRWPVEPGELGEAAGELRWFCFEDDGPRTGWHLDLAIEDPAEGIAWAVTATDRREDGRPAGSAAGSPPTARR